MGIPIKLSGFSICLSLVLFRLTWTFKHKNLTIGVIYPMSGSWAGGQGCLPAIEMALDDLNTNTEVLHDYRLNMEFNDSQCQPGLGTKVLYELLYTEPTKMMVLTGCSIVSTFVAQAAKMWNLIVLGYGSSSPALSNRERFPTFFRTHPSATLHNPTRVKLFEKFKWNRIATIQETQEVFTSTIEDLEERVRQANIEVVVRQNFLTDPENAVRNLKRQDARIIVGVFYENMARKVFCQAYKEKLFGKKYVWFIIGWYPDNWYRKQDPKINCTAEQLKEALEGHFTTEAVVLHQEYKVKTRSGMTSEDFKEKLDEQLNYTDTTQIVGYPEAPLAYDAVWALALALDKTAKKLQQNGSTLEEFKYDRTDITQEILSAMNETSFLGVSGNVAFSSQGDRIAWTQIEQMISECIKHSQPTINNITVIGSLLSLLCVFPLGLDNKYVHPDMYSMVCQVRAWLLSIGFSLGYGGMFSKIWTVHRIITADKKERKVLCVITAPITLIISTQQDAKFAFLALAILLSAFLSLGLIFVPKIFEITRNPKKSKLEVRTLSDSCASKEEEERHQRLLLENEELKKQIAEVTNHIVVYVVLCTLEITNHILVKTKADSGGNQSYCSIFTLEITNHSVVKKTRQWR
ncbi:hypothetical protein FSP39_022744 [Pinctada imbricata]|uniref:G-protein coupled receptors family 3 profile domain-containing protein n=1 Tax=Pinctada imbricata TaxID=66713 RepID=A0AA89BVB5_PINIB|nr:hypothetical protein FSP39_022744 [Pinctada imbricata]